MQHLKYARHGAPARTMAHGGTKSAITVRKQLDEALHKKNLALVRTWQLAGKATDAGATIADVNHANGSLDQLTQQNAALVE